MNTMKSKRLLGVLAAIYWAIVVLVYLVAGEQFHRLPTISDELTASGVVGKIVDGMELRQRIVSPASMLTSVDVMASTYGEDKTGVLNVTLVDSSEETVARGAIAMSKVKNEDYVNIAFEQPAQVSPSQALTLIITTQGCAADNALMVYTGTMQTTGQFDIIQSVSEVDRYVLDGETGIGKLCVKVNGVRELSFYKTYWLIVGGAFAIAAALCAHWWRQAKAGRNNPLVTLCTLYTRYNFLLKQLVMRDFNKKYKRSVLGVLWSFLNPLLTMSVQYIVFSTLFRRNIANFPVYLLCGVVFFGFFKEAVTMGMASITSNAPLIKKVHVPKYIYPLSRVISSLINLGLEFIPLLLVTLLTGLPIKPSFFLLVFDIICLLGFVMGMVLLLSTAMTFFQDTLFLWQVFVLLWNYLTPIFYPETIIPAKFLVFYHMNPMYQYITFARICIMDGVSPAPSAYLWCILSSAVVLMLGIVTFKRHQDEFVLYL